MSSTCPSTSVRSHRGRLPRSSASVIVIVLRVPHRPTPRTPRPGLDSFGAHLHSGLQYPPRKGRPTLDVNPRCASWLGRKAAFECVRRLSRDNPWTAMFTALAGGASSGQDRRHRQALLCVSARRGRHLRTLQLAPGLEAVLQQSRPGDSVNLHVVEMDLVVDCDWPRRPAHVEHVADA